MPTPQEKLFTILAEILDAERRGGLVDRQVLISQYPDAAEELRSFFALHDAMIRVAPDAAAKGRFDDPTLVYRDPNPADPSSVACIADKASDDPTRAIGRLRYFGDYELLEEIARGGMGIVYRARQASLNRLVALKMILAGQLASPEDVDRFRREAKAAANLDHPHIVPIYEVGEHEGRHYFSMKLIEGRSLSQAIGDGRQGIGEREAARLTAIVARAVHHAHQRGLLHRDLKPGNILLGANGEPHVTDFGLAKLVEGDSDLTRTGAVVGTPSYMAPEQAAASAQLTTAADVYSLGAILYELVTGVPPFRGDSPLQTLFAVVSEEPQSPRSLNPRLDRDIETICLKCLDKDPQRRFESAAALAGDLERWLRSEPIMARPAGPWTIARKWVRRRPAIATLLVLTALTALTGAAAVFCQWRHAEAALYLAEDNRYLSNISLAQHEQLGGAWERGDRLLNDCPLDRRGWEWRYLKRQCHPLVFSVEPDQGQSTAVAFHPDGRRIATAGVDGTVKLWDAKNGEIVGTMTHKAAVWALAFSPDGHSLATASGELPTSFSDLPDNEVIVWSLTNLKPGRRRIGHCGQRNSIAFSPDSRWLLFPIEGDKLVLWDVTTGREVKRFGPHTNHPSAVAFHPDGKRVASASGEFLRTQGSGVGGVGAAVKLWDVRDEKEQWSIAGNATCVAFDPEGQVLATDHGVWNAETGEPLWQAAEGNTSGRSMALTSDGHRLLSRTFSQGGIRLKIFDVATGSEVFDLFDQMPHHFEFIATSPAGLRIATLGERLNVLDGAIGQSSQILLGQQFPVTDLLPSPDGRYLAGVSSGFPTPLQGPIGPGETRVWDLRTAKRLMLPDDLIPNTATTTSQFWNSLTGEYEFYGARAEAAHAAAWSPDGKRLATACWDNSIRIWTIGKRQPYRILDRDPIRIHQVAWHPNGSQLVAGCDRGFIKMWDVETGKLVFGEQVHRDARDNRVVGLAWRRAGELLASSAASGEVRILPTDLGKVIEFLPAKEFDGAQFGQLSWSPNGRWLMRSKGSEITAWDAERDYRLLDRKEMPLSYGPIAWSADGNRLVGGVFTGKNYVQGMLIDFDSSKVVPLHGLRFDRVSAAAFSPDGARLAIASADRTLTLWNTTSGQPTLSIRDFSDDVLAVAFFNDGHRIAAGCKDGSVRLFDGKPHD